MIESRLDKLLRKYQLNESRENCTIIDYDIDVRKINDVLEKMSRDLKSRETIDNDLRRYISNNFSFVSDAIDVLQENVRFE